MSTRTKQRMIKRDYRNLPPGKALPFFRKVVHGLTDNANFPDETWGANTTSRQQLFDAVNRFEGAYHPALNGGKLEIAERDRIHEEVVVMLDEVASHLEAVAVRNPDALLSSGFNVVQERRKASRTKLPLASSVDFSVTNLGPQGEALGTSSAIPGSYNQEIHINYLDPSVEKNWLHKEIFPKAGEMFMTGINSGNVFFRMRSHGPNGAGPWSSVVCTFIT
jgi:hypothetical protein